MMLLCWSSKSDSICPGNRPGEKLKPSSNRVPRHDRTASNQRNQILPETCCKTKASALLCPTKQGLPIGSTRTRKALPQRSRLRTSAVYRKNGLEKTSPLSLSLSLSLSLPLPLNFPYWVKLNGHRAGAASAFRANRCAQAGPYLLLTFRSPSPSVVYPSCTFGIQNKCAVFAQNTISRPPRF